MDRHRRNTWIVAEPLVSQAERHQDDRDEARAAFGEDVVVAWRIVLVRDALDRAVADHRIQALCEHFAGHSEILHEKIHSTQETDSYTNDVMQFMTLRLGKISKIETMKDTARFERLPATMDTSIHPDATAAPLND